MTILDSDFLIDLLMGTEDANKGLKKLEEDGKPVGTTIINAYEILMGAMVSQNREINVQKTEALIRTLPLVGFTPPVSWVAARIDAELQKTGLALNFPDIAIGAIALVNNEVLVTRNVKHFKRIKGLEIQVW